MSFNDFVDATNDRRKGKLFASKNKTALTYFIYSEMIVIFVALVLLAGVSPTVAAYCCFVWILGLAYSFIPHWYITKHISGSMLRLSHIVCDGVQG